MVGVGKILDPRDHLGSGQAIALVTAVVRVIYFGSALIINRDRGYIHSMSSAPGRVIPSRDQPPSGVLDNNIT